jgi:hypothetical protein
MKFLGTTTVIAPIVLIILTLWLGLAFASPADAALTSSDEPNHPNRATDLDCTSSHRPPLR